MNKEQIFSQLWEKHSQEVFRFCMFRLNNKENAEDITAEVFIKLYKEDIASIQNPRAWLFTVCRNTIYDQFVKKKQIPMSSALTIENIELTEQQIKEVAQSAEKIALDKRMLELIEKELQNLPPKDSEIIILKIWHDLSFKEIAEITDLNESAVKQRFYRNLEKVIYNVNTPQKRRFRFGFKIRTLALTTLIAGIFKVSLAAQYHVNAESLDNVLNVKLATLGVGSFIGTSGVFGGLSAANTAAVGATATAAGSVIAGTTTAIGGGVAALSGGAQIAIAAIATAAITTGGLFGISQIQDFTQNPVPQENTQNQNAQQQNTIPNNTTQNQPNPQTITNQNTNENNQSIEIPLDECNREFNGTGLFAISLRYNSCDWSLLLDNASKSIVLKNAENKVSIISAENVFAKQFDAIPCANINAVSISDKIYRAVRSESTYYYEPAVNLIDKRNIVSEPSELYCPDTTQAFTINQKHFTITYTGSEEVIAEADKIVNSISILQRNIDEGEIKTKIYTDGTISFSYSENLQVKSNQGVVTAKDSVQVETVDTCTSEKVSTIEYLYIDIHLLPVGFEEYKNSFIIPAGIEGEDATISASFKSADIYGKKGFIETSPGIQCGFIKYIIPSGSERTFVINRKILPEEESLSNFKLKEEIQVKKILQSLQDLQTIYEDIDNPTQSIDIFLLKNDYEPVAVWRTVRNADKLTAGLDLLLAGPDDNDKSRGLKPVINFTSDSNCNGQNYAVSNQQEKVFIQFCKSIQSDNKEHQKSIVSSIYKTINGITNKEYINIKDKDGNCLFGISQTGMNSCQPNTVPIQ